jgi:hypothetical protein
MGAFLVIFMAKNCKNASVSFAMPVCPFVLMQKLKNS